MVSQKPNHYNFSGKEQSVCELVRNVKFQALPPDLLNQNLKFNGGSACTLMRSTDL